MRTFLTCGLAATLAAAAVHAPARAACPTNAPSVIVYHAGSLTTEFQALEKLFTQRTGACVDDHAAGSLDAARQITVGGQPADVFAAADFLDIDLLLRPAGYAAFDLIFARSSLVLAYTTNSKGADTIAAPGPFDPPNTVPGIAQDWAQQLTSSSAVIGGSNPFLDPAGYHADQIFQLAALQTGQPGLYNTLLEHYAITRPTDVLGQTYDYQITYASSAYASYKANPSTYRYVTLPPSVNLSSVDQEVRYAQAATAVPGLTPGSLTHVLIPGAPALWGITILRTAPHPVAAQAFLQLLFSGDGLAIQQEYGPTPINPPVVSPIDYGNLPPALKPYAQMR